MSRYVSPEPTVLPISKGDTLTVRKRLNHGEHKEMTARMYRFAPNGDLRVDPLAVADQVAVSYLLDWTLKYPDGTPIVIRDRSPKDIQAALDGLDPDDVAEIRTVIERHVAAMTREREQEKNVQDGAITSAVISPSVAQWDGGTTTSLPSTRTFTANSLAG